MATARARILVVGESPELCKLFEDGGHEVATAADGAFAVKAAQSGTVDLIALDLALPGMDGMQTARMVRAASGRRLLPILITSAVDDREERLAALKLGVDEYVGRPWDSDELLARVDRLLALRRRFDALLDESTELHKLSVTDGLTQVANHRHFQERLREELRRAQRYDDPLALILLDLDHFKGVNDQFGHPAGDQVLRDVAASIKKSVRETDFVARYGGEEFAIILPKTHLGGSLTVAERVWQDVQSLKVGPGGSLRITASLGVSSYPNRAVVSADQLLRTADDALYRAKREGRNKIALHQPAMAGFSDTAAKTG